MCSGSLLQESIGSEIENENDGRGVVGVATASNLLTDVILVVIHTQVIITLTIEWRGRWEERRQAPTLFRTLLYAISYRNIMSIVVDFHCI